MLTGAVSRKISRPILLLSKIFINHPVRTSEIIGFILVEGRYPAACREFVIPADPGSGSGAGAGIQRARLDSPVSSMGQAPYQVRGRLVKHGMTGQNRRRYLAACRWVVHLILRGAENRLHSRTTSPATSPFTKGGLSNCLGCQGADTSFMHIVVSMGSDV